MVVENRKEFEKIKKVAAELFIAAELPAQLYKNGDNWNFIFLESGNIFNSETYNTFISLIKDFKERSIYLVPNDIIKMNVNEFFEGLLVKNILYIPIINFSPDLVYADFDVLQKKYLYHLATNSYLFGSKNQWGVYVDTDINLMVLGFDSSLRNIIEKHYGNHVDHISSVDNLIDYMDLWFGTEEKKTNVRQELLKNYSSAFK